VRNLAILVSQDATSDANAKLRYAPTLVLFAMPSATPRKRNAAACMTNPAASDDRTLSSSQSQMRLECRALNAIEVECGDVASELRAKCSSIDRVRPNTTQTDDAAKATVNRGESAHASSV